jgi:soluble lytic murein transglycosylase-like protein
MKRRFMKSTFWVMLLVLGTGALSGGMYLRANAAGDSSAQAGEYYYGPVNCHSDPALPDTSGSRKPYADFLVNTIAPRYHLEAAVLLWQVNQESGFNPEARSPAGAIGIAQFMPATAAAYHLDPTNPWQSLDGMARYDLASLRAFWGWSHTIAVQFGGNRNAYVWGLALAAYNAGGPNTGKAVGWAARYGWNHGPWTWLWWFGDANQTFYYVPDILGCEATR